MPRLADVIAALDAWFDPHDAESWDAVGLVCGVPGGALRRVHLAVDATPEVVDDAIAAGAGLLLTHHPLLLTGVHGVPADDPKGALVHRLIRAGTALFVAHTNADVASPGVSDALAARIGLAELTPLSPLDDRDHDGAGEDAQRSNSGATDLYTLSVHVPVGHSAALIDAMGAAGAGAVGSYDRCSWTVEGTGSFRPLPGAAPAVGRIGRLQTLPETRVEMVVDGARAAAVLQALRATHPYEQPAYSLVRQARVVTGRWVTGRGGTARGTGRVGDLLSGSTLAELLDRVASALPATSWGVRAAGDPQRPIRRVAVCGGSGASLIEQARRAGADAYLTADLRHHRAIEAVTELGADAMALIDAAHWATEAPWLDDVAERLHLEFGTNLEVHVSTRVTDPWTLHRPSARSSDWSAPGPPPFEPAPFDPAPFDPAPFDPAPFREASQ